MSKKQPPILKTQVLRRIHRRKNFRERAISNALAFCVHPTGNIGREVFARRVGRDMRGVARHYGRRAEMVQLAIQRRALAARKTDQRARTSWRA